MPHAGSVLAPYMRLRYTWQTYPYGAWESLGRSRSAALFASDACDVVVGMANGCPDPEIQARLIARAWTRAAPHLARTRDSDDRRSRAGRER